MRSDDNGPLFIVLNAGSGRGDARARKATIQGVLEDAGQRHEFLIVEDLRQMPSFARHAVEMAQDQHGIGLQKRIWAQPDRGAESAAVAGADWRGSG